MTVAAQYELTVPFEPEHALQNAWRLQSYCVCVLPCEP